MQMVIKMKKIFCVDIGGSKLICGALTPDGNIVDTYRFDFPKEYSPDTIIEQVTIGYRQLAHHDFYACAIAVPGLCDHKSGKWLYSPFTDFKDIAITEIVSNITHLPTYADNDVNLSALAEKHYGICKDDSDFLWITVSNGIGGGLYLDGNLYRGHNLSAGEIGHFVVENNGRKCGCKNRGCLEAHASGASISALFCERTGIDIPAKEIATLARNGNADALSVWEEAGAYIGKAVSYAVNLLGLEKIILGGGAAEAFDLLEPSCTREMEKYVFKAANPDVEIMHSANGKWAALKGCAALVLEKEGDFSLEQVFKDYINDIERLCGGIDTKQFKSVCDLLLEGYKQGKNIFVAGNGGSAGTSNHFCCDFGKNAVKGDTNRPKIISLSANIEVLTALGNDFCYAEVFSQQLKNLMNDGDIVLLISASGNSPNIVSAAEYAKTRGGTVIGFSGFKGGKLKELSDINVNIPSNSYEQIEDLHMMLTHMIVCYFKKLELK